MKWNNTLVTLLISGLQVVFFTGLHEIPLLIRNIFIAVGNSYFAEPICMNLFSLRLFRMCRSLFCQNKENVAYLHYFQ